MRSHIPGTQDNRERKAEQGYGQGAAGGGLLNSGSGSGRDTGYGSGTGNTGSGNTGYGSGSGNTGTGRETGYGSVNTGSGQDTGYGGGSGNTGSGLVPSDEQAGLTAMRGSHGSGVGSGHTGAGTGHGHGTSTGTGTHDSSTEGQQGGAAAKLKAHLPGTKEYKAAHGKGTDTDTTTGTGNGSHTGRDTATGKCSLSLNILSVHPALRLHCWRTLSCELFAAVCAVLPVLKPFSNKCCGPGCALRRSTPYLRLYVWGLQPALLTECCPMPVHLIASAEPRLADGSFVSLVWLMGSL